MIYIATLAIGLAFFTVQIATEWYRSQCRQSSALDHAANIFPHPNENKRSFQRRKL